MPQSKSSPARESDVAKPLRPLDASGGEDAGVVHAANGARSAPTADVPRSRALGAWHARRARGERQAPLLMGILNVTPDSFFDGGRHAGFDEARRHAERMASEGADFIDIGGESTRPGASPVSVEEELARVLPLVESLHADLDVDISVDTSRPEVIEAATAAGAVLVNDVRALTAPGALAAAAASGADVCLMHMRGEPRTMQVDPVYDDVVAEVHAYLCTRRDACVDAGIGPARIVLDPGIGFGKNLGHNLALLKGVEEWAARADTVLVGASRKSMLGELLGQPVERRLYGSLAIAQHAARAGAAILRVHDVQATREALTVWMALEDIHPSGVQNV